MAGHPRALRDERRPAAGQDVSDPLTVDPIRPTIAWFNGRKPGIHQWASTYPRYANETIRTRTAYCPRSRLIVLDANGHEPAEFVQAEGEPGNFERRWTGVLMSVEQEVAGSCPVRSPRESVDLRGVLSG